MALPTAILDAVFSVGKRGNRLERGDRLEKSEDAGEKSNDERTRRRRMRMRMRRKMMMMRRRRLRRTQGGIP
eukprot:3666351-Rhodomonas_salina.4